MTEYKTSTEGYSLNQIKAHIFTMLSAIAQTMLRQRTCYITVNQAASIIAEYEDILHFVTDKMSQDVIDQHLHVNDPKGLYTDRCVYKAFILRYIPEFDDLDFKRDYSIEELIREIIKLKYQKRVLNHTIRSYPDNWNGPPNLGLEKVTKATEKYDELYFYNKVPMDVLLDKREDIVAKTKQLLLAEEEYTAHLREYNKLKREISKYTNRMVILRKKG